ncbi:MAG: MATE family efflux transporter, partial [Lachnospiraceae bacterium]|nr:MATE family efflux transporter [Lachnospiraceae bacterium]
MHSRSKIDMTTGSIMKAVILFALPLCFGNVLQQLYSTVDTLIIGNFCGSIALAAVGTSSQPVEIFMGVFMGIGNGVSILIAMYTGKKSEYDQMRVVTSAITFIYITAIPLTLLGILLTPGILTLMQVPSDTMALATLYTRIVFLGSLGSMGYNMNAGILRGIGDSTASLIFLLISSVINIVLDYLFVAILGMDVGGVALATIIAMFFSWISSILYIRRKYPELDFTFFPRVYDARTLTEILKIGVPLGLNNSIYCIGHVLLQAVINAQGSVFMAGCAIATKINALATMAVNGFSASASTFAGQNFGAGTFDRLRKGAYRITFFNGLFAMVGGALCTIFGAQLSGLFNSDPAVIAMSVRYINVVLPFYWCFAVLNTILNIANGVGAVRYSTVSNLLMLWAIRIPTSYLIAFFFDGTYCMAGISVSFVCGMITMLCFFRSKRW